MASTDTERCFYFKTEHSTCGVAAVHDDQEYLSIAVLPRFWPCAATASRLIEWSGDAASNISLAVHENQKITFKVGASRRMAARVQLVERLLKLGASVTPSHKEKSKEQQGLLKAEVSFPTNNAYIEPAGVNVASFDALFNLIALFGNTQSDDIGHALLPHERRSDPLIMELIHRRFTAEVRRHIRHVRRGYRLNEETLSVVRGRIVTQSLAEHVTIGQPQLRCIYDEFTEVTPLFQILVTTLDVVAGGQSVSSTIPVLGGYLAQISKTTANDAIQLRRWLMTVPSLTVAQAHGIAQRLRLPPSYGRWASALDLARLILSRAAIRRADAARIKNHDVLIHYPTHQIWERILQQLLIAGKLEPKWKEPVDAPWKNSRNQTLGAVKAADLIVRVQEQSGDSSLFCLDAKYKHFQKTPDAADQYQLFAYSHMYGGKQQGEAVRYCGLLYPKKDGLIEVSVPESEHIYARQGTGGPCALFRLQVPFIQPKHLGEKKALEAYFAELGQILTAALEAIAIQEAQGTSTDEVPAAAGTLNSA